MLAVNSKRYRIPQRIRDGDGVAWILKPTGQDFGEVTRVERFTYTYLYNGQRASFVYDGASVKPSPRTLRVFGAEKTGSVVKFLASNTEQDADYNWFDLFGILPEWDDDYDLI